MAIRAYTWNKSTGGTGLWNDVDNWTGGGGGYPGNGGGTDDVTFPTGMEPCTANAAVDIRDLTINSDHSGADVIMTANMSCSGNVEITQGELQTGDFNFKVTGTTVIYGTLTPGASTCYFGYGNTASSTWDLGVRGTGVLNAGTGDWYTGGVGFYSGADVTLTAGTMYISGSHSGLVWSPDQSVGSWDNNDGTVLIQKTGDLRTYDVDPLTAADNQICPFYNLIISGGADRTDAPVINLKRGMKVDNELIIKNGVLKWHDVPADYNDVWVGTGGTQLTGAASQSAAIVMDDMPLKSKFVSHSGSSTADWGMVMEGNAIVSGATANIHLGTLSLQSDASNSALAANKTITGLNGSPYFHFPAGEACAVFDGTNDYLNVGNVAELNGTENFTISMWIKFGNPAPSEKNYLFAKGPSGVNSTTMRWSDGSGGNLYWYVNNGGSTYGRSSFTAATGYGWNHIAMVYDGTFTDGDTDTQNNGRLKAYVNGVLQTQSWSGEIPATTTNDTPTSEAVLGITEPGSSTDVFFGSMADVRVYDESKDITAVAALAATNPATSTTGTYPATGTGLVGWWKLQPYQIVDGNGSGDMDFSDSSTSSYDATNIGTSPGWGSTNIYQRTAWISLRSYQRDLISNNTFGAGVEGRGSTMYIRPAIGDLSVGVADSGYENSNTNYAAGLAFKFNNFNICAPSAGNGILKSQSRNTGCGLLDITGDLFIASGSSLVVSAHSSIDARTDDIVGDIYVTGNLLIYGTWDGNDSTMVDALDDGYISRMPQLLVGALTMAGDGTYNATPYYTIVSGSVGSKNVEGYNWTPIYQYGTATLTHNNGTFWNKSNKGYIGYKQAGGDLGPYYNYIQDFDEEPQHVQNTNLRMLGDFTLSGAATEGSKGAWGLRNESTYTLNVSGNMILKDGGCFGCPNQDNADRFNIGKNLELGSGSRLVLPNVDNNATVVIGGSLFNRGGLIYDGDVS